MTRVILGFSCLALLGAVACSGSTVITSASPNDGGTVGEPGDDAGSSSGSSGGGGSRDSGASSSGDAGSSGGGGSEKLYPIAVGNTWTYDVAAAGAGSVCGAGSHDQSVTAGPTTLDGKAAYSMTSFCTGASGASQVAPDPSSDAVAIYYNDGWLTFIDVPLMDGHTWQYFNSSYTWQRETSVTVPAGTFTDCWTAKQNVSYTAYLTYCRGVGMVRSYSADLTGAGWDAKLSRKNF